MKKNTVTTLLIVGAAAAVYFIMRSRRKGFKSSVEALSPIKITEEEYEAAVTEEPAEATFTKGAQTVVDIFKKLKRSPEKRLEAQQRKKAGKARKVLKKNPKADVAVTKFLSMPRVMRGVDDISVLY